ncbi:50S ribosomal protein L31 [Candidatus Shapirobacteria bacterium CG09_land_8_20_14_0_10_38_17]|uniref:Large ribosomal subunit protein bL31 n=1 Tax=Candidatus Shapirobacteria bacterium CG09_land_8_20_14_0_10_38_17 TaxID=1974884 RepID=A0A2H0WSW4_9BACT|nr:MAG: 50S ribosomal protein L31 [Candidatus Shapirobacteria bacterium CG09_land_8_20_14_0_10_38_17]
MKKNIHPQYYPQAKVTCTCGNTFFVGSTKPEIKVEICSACHPFFTGEMKYVDTGGRVKRFEEQQRVAATNQYQKEKLHRRKEAFPSSTRSLKEMLKAAK